MEFKPRNDEPDEETLLRLIEKREKNLRRCNEKMLYYTSQMKCEASELNKLKVMLEAVRSKEQSAKSASIPLLKKPKLESESNFALKETKSEPSKKPQLFIPAMLVAKSKPISVSNHDTSHQMGIGSQPMLVAKSRPISVSNHDTSHQMGIEKARQLDMVQSVGTSANVANLNFNSTNLIHSQHKKKLRCLDLCPTDDTVFASSGLDGAVSLWEVQNKGNSAKFLGSMDCLSPNQRRWPEDIAWHPDGQRIFAVHSAEGGDSQVSSFSLKQLGRKKTAFFLENKAHEKGTINRISFMPWRGQSSCFVTSGSDHAVVLWKEGKKDGCWGQKLLHMNHHTSAVMAAFGLQYKEAVLSVGMDRRVVLFDIVAGSIDFKFQLDSKCLNALPSPSNSNLYLVQIGSPGKQLRLFDIREKPEELHVFGWDQGQSEPQSALINSAWSPDGWHISSGSNDPLIHIFDIRYSGQRPSESLKAHSKRVFKAVWHSSLPLLISISSDQHIGMHRYL
ncbi:U5 small nuclear ribonucleoprotein [Carex littledalei]|uniref:U5 small nuclear ribonucleoprotein n=1 Tax=Carex littledalei TaxID=544730 RepID=A0A833R2H5_9POAL|nr:U5 small nuclear ribonucleoprotein [Carex littledalei]